MATTQYFNYDIEALYINSKGNPIDLDRNTIQAIIIDNNYSQSMPIIYVTLKIRTALFNDMEANSNKSSIILTIHKKVKTGVVGIKSSTMKAEFSYIITNTPDTNRELDNDYESMSYKVTTLGLFHMSILNGNNIEYGSENNMIIKNTDMESIVFHFIRHLPIIMEPFKDKIILPHVVIPPLGSVSSLLTYLNKVHSFYDTQFMYYRDFNNAYLLSSTQNIRTDVMQYESVIIKILDTSEYKTRLLSTQIETDKDAYVLYIDAATVMVSIDNVTSKRFNSIIGVTPDGEVKKVNTDFGRIDSRAQNRETVMRLPHNDFSYLTNIANSIKEGFRLELSKNEIDTDIFTPNRIYHIQNFSSFSIYDGKFRLASKRDILLQNNDAFISKTYIQLYKVE